MSLLWFIGITYFAATAPAQHTAHGPVSVTLVGNGAQLEELARLLQQGNPSLDLRRVQRIRATEIFDDHGARVAVWVVAVPGWGAKIYFVDPMDRRFLVREVPLTAGLDESGREILAQVVSNTTRVFVERQASSTRLEMETSLRADRAEPLADVTAQRQPSRVRLTGVVVPDESASGGAHHPAWKILPSAFYAAHSVGPDRVNHGPGVSVGVARDDGAWRWLFALRGQYRLPLSVEVAGAHLELSSWAVGVATSMQRSMNSGWLLGVQLGVIAARTEFGLSEVSTPTIVAAPTAVHYRPSVDAGICVGHDLGAIRLTLLLGAEVALTMTHYDIGGTPIFSPWLVSPRSALEVFWQ